MAMTFDATLKDMGRDSPQGFLAAFDRPPIVPVKLLNVDLSTVTTAADLILGLGEPVEEVIQLDFQSSAAAWKHADLMVYNALLFAHYHVAVHTILILLRPEAAHANLNGVLRERSTRDDARAGTGRGRSGSAGRKCPRSRSPARHAAAAPCQSPEPCFTSTALLGSRHQNSTSEQDSQPAELAGEASSWEPPPSYFDQTVTALFLCIGADVGRVKPTSVWLCPPRSCG